MAMNNEHFQTLLARVLDDELTPTESDELIAWLRQNPAAGSEVNEQLQLWELFSQQVRAERSSGAFAEACRTRLLANADERKFVHETELRLRRSVEPDGISLADRLLHLRQRITRWLLSPRRALAAAVIMVCVFVLPGFLRPQGVPELASFTGTQIQILRGGQAVTAQGRLRLQPDDVIRTTGEGRAVISYDPEATRIELESNSELKLLTWNSGKRVNLRAGKLEATVARQRAFQPMILVTRQAEARVLGTKFTLTAETNATRLEVTEGNVELIRKSDDAVVKVSAGHYFVAATNVELAAQSLTGRILREYWTGISGDGVGMLTTHTNYPDKPSGWDFLNSFEEPTNLSGGYGTRIRGYLYPPKTGQYRFWVAADDSAELYLSADDSPDQKDVIASLYFHSQPREWSKYPWQQSSPIKLKSNHRYYIELLHKKNDGAGHLAVAWQTPGGKQEIITGTYLAPFKTDAEEKKQ
jgi:hypothetical protein